MEHPCSTGTGVTMRRNKLARSGAQGVSTDGDSSRRRFLKGAATAGIAAAGVGAASTQAAAQWFGGGDDGSTTGVETFDLGTFGASELPHSDESELVIYLHGGGVSDSANTQGQDLEDGLADAGFDTTVVAGVFDTGSVGIGEATSDAGDHLAGLIEGYMDSGGSVHVIGYSLGGIVTYQTLNALGSGYSVDTAASIGTGTPDDTFCEGNTYYDGVANNADSICVLTSDNDSAVSTMNGADTGCGGGFFGGGSAPSNLEQIDVTSDVDSHLVYLESSLVMEELADCFGGATGSSGTSGTTGSDSGTGIGWW